MIDWWYFARKSCWWNFLGLFGWTIYFGSAGKHFTADVTAISCLLFGAAWCLLGNRHQNSTVKVNRPTAERLAEWKVNFWADVEITAWGLTGDKEAEETRDWFRDMYYDSLVKHFKELGYD